MTVSTDVRKAVQRGAALLDDANPGWESQINPAYLVMHSCSQCVLGQVFDAAARDEGIESGYDAGAWVLGGFHPEDPEDGPLVTWAIVHGFTVVDQRNGDWDELRQGWLDLIRERQS